MDLTSIRISKGVKLRVPEAQMVRLVGAAVDAGGAGTMSDALADGGLSEGLRQLLEAACQVLVHQAVEQTSHSQGDPTT